MQILLNSDNHIKITSELKTIVDTEVEHALQQFGDRVTRVEVHISDENSRAKDTENDKRCLMEARLAGLQPVAVSHRGSTIEQAVEGAAEKLRETLNQTVERLNNPKGRTSFAGE